MIKRTIVEVGVFLRKHQKKANPEEALKTLDDILKATRHSDLFKEGTKKELRSLLKLSHPDMHPNESAKAQKAFIHINSLWKMKDEPDRPMSAGKNAPSASSDTVITKKNEYHHLKSVRKSNGVETFRGVDSEGNSAFLLISTHPKIGGMLMEGVRRLKKVKEGIINASFKEFFPDTIDAFKVKQGSEQFGAVQTLPITNYSLREVKEDYPEGIDGRDIAWMYRRMLVAVGNMHDNGIGHGAPNLDAFLITPATHELQVTNWQFSNELGNEILMLNSEVKHHYSTDRLITREKDLQILSEAALSLIHPDTPRQIKAFLKGMSKYPTNTAQEALHEFDEALKETYGPRAFHEFRMRRS